MERLTIEELIAHCNRQLGRLQSGSVFYQEHESTRAYLQILRHYIALGTVEELTALVKDRDEGRVVVLPCKVGDWLYYVLDDKVSKAKVEEILCGANKRAPEFDFTVFAWDFAAKDQLTFCPGGESWMGGSGDSVHVFLARAEAEAALSGGGVE